MAGRSVLARIDDMLAAIGMIETIMRDTPAVGPERTVADLALERAIEIVSEASRHIPEDLKAAETEVRWRMLAGIGNVLRHDYPERTARHHRECHHIRCSDPEKRPSQNAGETRSVEFVMKSNTKPSHVVAN